MDRHAQGILLIMLSAVAYSSAGSFTRLIHLDAWTMLFWRGLFAGLMILCVIAVQERSNSLAAMRAIGRPGVAAALCSTVATILYLNAFRRTSVADVAVIFAAAPFLTAGLGWLCLGLREAWTTLAASSRRHGRCECHGQWRSGRRAFDRRSSGFRYDLPDGGHDVDHSPTARDANAACGVSFGRALSTRGLTVHRAVRDSNDRCDQALPVRNHSIRPGSRVSRGLVAWSPPPKTHSSTHWSCRSPSRGYGYASARFRPGPASLAASSLWPPSPPMSGTAAGAYHLCNRLMVAPRPSRTGTSQPIWHDEGAVFPGVARGLFPMPAPPFSIATPHRVQEVAETRGGEPRTGVETRHPQDSSDAHERQH
jgi:EamA-like transporter family